MSMRRDPGACPTAAFRCVPRVSPAFRVSTFFFVPFSLGVNEPPSLPPVALPAAMRRGDQLATATAFSIAFSTVVSSSR